VSSTIHALVMVGVLARSAYATGVCENTERSYDPPELFDEATQSFAIPVTQPWCDVVVTNDVVYDEVRGTVRFVELRDVSNQVVGVLSTAQGDDAKHLREHVGDFEHVPYGKLHATLVKRGYAPIVAPKKCALAGAWTDVDPPASRTWRGAVLQLDVVAGGKRLQRMKLGDGSVTRRGDQLVRGHAVAKQTAIAVFATVPSCAGPPPGYFGPDDGGDCYQVNTPVVLKLDPKSTPPLAACF
jgi:hypothetical protein